MNKFIAGIRHHSIASAHTIEIDGTLTQAKRAATKEFGGEQLDYQIVILDSTGEIVASRKVGASVWQ